MTSPFKLTRFAVILASLAVAVPAWSLSAPDIARIEQAIPKKATAKPEKPRRVLVFSQTLGYHHASIPYAEKALELMGETTGAFEVDSSSDPSVLVPENLEKYDAIVLNNPTGEWLTTPSMRQGLLKFVSDGKGLMGIHAASDGNFEWPEFGKLIGGYFQNHPWRASDTVTLKVNQPDHPVAKAFAGKSLEINDEIYQITDPYSRDAVLELVSLDTDKTDMTKEGITRTDGDFPVSWVHSYGEGRVFYTSLGHNEHIYSNPMVLQHYLDGLQYALGDLQADSGPGSRLIAAAAPATAAAQASGEKVSESDERYTTGTASAKSVSEEDFNAAVEKLDDYDFGDERDFLLTIDEAIRASADDEARRREMTDAFLEKATNDDLSYAARDLALRRLGEIGHESAAAKIQPVLLSKDDKLAESALRALTNIPGDVAEAALVKSLDDAPGAIRVGIMNALGQRGAASADAIAKLTEIAREGKNGEVIAAVTALGKIGTRPAGQALLNKVRPPDAAREAWLAAMNSAAANLAADDAKLAGKLYDHVMKMAEADPARLAAFRGKAGLDDNPEQVALESLDSDDDGIRQVARQILVRGDDNAGIADDLLAQLKTASPGKKVVVVEILGARADKAALDDITALASQASPGESALQLAAIGALKHLGDQNSVPVLLKIAADQKGKPAAAATESIVEMRVPEVDAALLEAINEAASPDEQVVAIEAAVERKSADIVPELLEAAESPESKVAVAALKALSETAKDGDLSAILKIHNSLRDAKVIKEAGRTVASLSRKSKKKGDASQAVQKAFDSAKDDATKRSLLGVMGSIGGKAALKTLEANIDSSDQKTQDAAVRALAEFPDATALPTLMKITADGESQVHKVLALRGVARLLSQAGEGDPQQRLDMAKKAIELAPGAEEKRAIIGAAADIQTTGVIDFLLPFLDDADLKEETVAALLKQAPVANQIDPGKTAEQLNPLNEKLSNEQWNKLEEVLTPGDGSEGAGAIRAFQISAIYGDDDDKGPKELITTPYAPEKDNSGWQGIVWAGIDEGGDKVGKADLLARFPGKKNVVVYLRAHVWSPEKRTVELRSGSDDGLWVLVNGTQEIGHDGTRGFEWDEDKKKIELNRGWNELFFKVSQGTKDWAVAARLLDEDGKPMSDLKYSALPQQ